MPAADYSSYHQPNSTGADGTKFDNFIDAVQATVNGLDKNNLAANAGVLASQLADPTTGKVLGSAASACAAVFPPGYEWAYAEFTGTVTAVGATHTEVAPIDVVSAGAVTYDGAPVVVEFFVPNMADGNAITTGISLWDSTDLGRLWDSNTVLVQAVGGTFKRRYTPSAGAHTIKVRAWSAGTAGQNLAVSGGAGGPGVRLPGFIRVTKA